jgi:broad specificity phosphatase PhoE
MRTTGNRDRIQTGGHALWNGENESAKHKYIQKIASYTKAGAEIFNDGGRPVVYGTEEDASAAAEEQGSPKKVIVRVILVRHGIGLHNVYQANSETISSGLFGVEEDYQKHNKSLRAVKDVDIEKYNLISNIIGNATENKEELLCDPSLTPDGVKCILTPKLTTPYTYGRELFKTHSPVSKIYVSPLKRTIQTAYVFSATDNDAMTTEHINKAETLGTFLNRTDVILDERCREAISAGGGNVFDKLMYNKELADKITNANKTAYTALFDGKRDKRFYNSAATTATSVVGDADRTLIERGHEFIDDILKTAAADAGDGVKTIAVSTHSGFLFALLHGVFAPDISIPDGEETSDPKHRKFVAWFNEGEGRDFYFLVDKTPPSK